MQSGLNLRIPDPSNKTIKEIIARSNSPSPKPAQKILNAVSYSSAYKRIISNLSLKKLAIPTFLQTFPGPSKNSQKSSLQISIEAATNTSSVKTEQNKATKSSLKTAKEIYSFVFSEDLSENESILQIGKINLTRAMLKTLHPDSSIDREVIDASFRCFKHINRKLFKNNEDHDRVLLINTQFSEKIFTCSSYPPCKRNSLKYNKVVFPLFLGYWTVVSLDTRRLTLTFYNDFDEETSGKILTSVKKFLNNELKFHENKRIDCCNWRNLGAEKNVVIAQDDSACCLRIAYKVAVKEKAELDEKSFPVFRFKLLVILFNHGIVKCN